MTRVLTLCAFCLLALGAALLAQGQRPAPAGVVPALCFHTSGQATTPQMPFWAAVKQGALPELAHLEVRHWKNLDDLRASLLAGQGDIWLGHLEGFAQAALRGAPVRLVAVTGWRKFSVLTTRPGARELADLAGPDGVVRLAVTPRESPAVALLREAGRRGGPPVEFTRAEPRQLLLDASRGAVRDMVVPEPLTTVLLDKVPGLRVLAAVEDLYSRAAGGDGTLPLAGLAVHARLCEERPELVENLLQAMQDAVPALAADPDAAVAVLPADFAAFIDPATVRRSLERDPVRVRPAAQCREAVRAYLALVLPESVGPDGASRLPEGFFWP